MTERSSRSRTNLPPASVPPYGETHASSTARFRCSPCPLCLLSSSCPGGSVLISGLPNALFSCFLRTRKWNTASDPKTYSRRAQKVRQSRRACAICVQAQTAHRSLLFADRCKKADDLAQFPLASGTRRLSAVFITGAIPCQRTPKGKRHEQATLTSRLCSQHAEEGWQQRLLDAHRFGIPTSERPRFRYRASRGPCSQRAYRLYRAKGARSRRGRSGRITQPCRPLVLPHRRAVFFQPIEGHQSWKRSNAPAVGRSAKSNNFRLRSTWRRTVMDQVIILSRCSRRWTKSKWTSRRIEDPGRLPQRGLRRAVLSIEAGRSVEYPAFFFPTAPV